MLVGSINDDGLIVYSVSLKDQRKIEFIGKKDESMCYTTLANLIGNEPHFYTAGFKHTVYLWKVGQEDYVKSFPFLDLVKEKFGEQFLTFNPPFCYSMVV